MKKFLAMTVALATLNLSVFAATPLRRGTTVSVRITSDISSKQSGSPSAFVENDVTNADGRMVIKRGTPVQLDIKRTKARGAGKPGEVTVRCISTTAVDGQAVSLEGTTSETGDSKKGLALGLGIGLGLTFLPFVGFALCAIKGQQAVVEANTVIHNVMVTGDYQIAD